MLFFKFATTYVHVCVQGVYLRLVIIVGYIEHTDVDV